MESRTKERAKDAKKSQIDQIKKKVKVMLYKEVKVLAADKEI